MEILLPILLLAVGIFLIVKGGDFFVDSASWMAEVSGIPPLIVGATVVSVATTLPELLVSIIATAGGSVEIACGNAVGSVVANTGLIMAISLIFLPSVIKRSEYAFKSILLCATCGVLWLVCMDGFLPWYLGLIVFACFVAFVIENVKGALKQSKLAASDAETRGEAEEPVKKDRRTVIINIIKFVLGAAGIVIGADLLVDNGQILAEKAGVPEGIIAVTLVAIGTSLPELVTTVTAIVKKKASLSVGNIIGANILDMSMILPICSFVSGGKLVVPDEALMLDIPFCMGLSLIAVIPPLFTRKFQRWQGFALLAVYAVYLYLRITMTA